VFRSIQKLSDRLVQALAPKATVKASWECDEFCYCDSRGSHYRQCTCWYIPEFGGLISNCSLNCGIHYNFC
jgi:hypothetical protein